MAQVTDQSWAAGAQLEVIPVATEYLKREGKVHLKDKSTRDNLENLLTF